MTEPGRTKTLTKYFHDSRQFCYVLTDLHGVCIYGNPFFLQQCGFTTIDCEGFSFTQFLREPEFEKHMALSNRILQSEGSPLIHEFQHGSEEIMPVTIRWEIRLLEIREDGNGIIQYLGTVITPGEKGRDTGITTVCDRERYEAYEMSDEALWRLELEVPVSVEISSEQLISHIYLFGYIAECNDHMARMHGWERSSDLVGKKLEAIMSMEQTMQCEKMKSFTTNGFTLRNCEMEAIDGNGRRLYFNINLKGIVEQGMLKRVWGTQHDITERKKAEEERLRSELFYRNLIADSLDGILLTDTNGIITFASPSVEKILGYRPEEILQTPAFAHVHPDDREVAKSAFEDEVRMEPLIKFIDVRLKTKYDEWLYCNVRGHNMLYNPYVGRMVIYFHDDSRRKAVEDMLRSSEQRFRQLIDNLQTGVMLHDITSEVLICNKAAHNLLGLTEDQLLGRSAVDPAWKLQLEDGTDFPEESQPVATAIRTGQPVRGRIMGVFRPGTGDTAWLLVNAEPIFNEDGGILYVINSFTDITEQKRLAQELIDQEIQEQKLLTRATIDAQEKERREIGKELHDNISQHLTTTRLYLEVASDKSEGALQEMIRHAQKQLSEIIVEIRNISQSLVPPTLGDIGLIESIEDICNSLKRVYPFTIHYDHEEFDESTLSDNMKLMFFRIIQEQLNNIIRHSGADHIRLQLKTTKEQAILSMIDNGKGFDPSVTRKGLGLSNIANRAGLFNGRMDIISNPGEGCTIRVTLPLK